MEKKIIDIGKLRNKAIWSAFLDKRVREATEKTIKEDLEYYKSLDDAGKLSMVEGLLRVNDSQDFKLSCVLNFEKPDSPLRKIFNRIDKLLKKEEN